LSQANRVETMAHKLAVYALRAGVTDVGLLTDAFYLAVRPRLDKLRDVFHIDVLHPARSALILLEHSGCRDARVLAAAALTETFDAALRAPHDEMRALGHDVVSLADAVPAPAGEDEALLERLLVADPDVASIAVAERLDHARHLHMRAPALWPSYFRQSVRVYLPVAQRVAPELHARFERWARAFERRLA
jgi:hypothetical protein